MTRDELIERIAVALCEEQQPIGSWVRNDSVSYREIFYSEAKACIAAIETADCTIVPNMATDAEIKAGVDYRLGTTVDQRNDWQSDTINLRAAMIATSPYRSKT